MKFNEIRFYYVKGVHDLIHHMIDLSYIKCYVKHDMYSKDEVCPKSNQICLEL